jgi:CO/xanthine dehydrogenase Mo-binding subunit
VRFTVAVVSIAVDELAKQLYVDPGDVRVILATLTDEPIADAVSNELSGEVRTVLDGFGFRTTDHAAALNQADMDTWREETDLQKPDGLSAQELREA